MRSYILALCLAASATAAEIPKGAQFEVDSVWPVYKSADWLEREAYDMFGLRFRGHPDLRRILMWEQYKEGFPLRKDYVFPRTGRLTKMGTPERLSLPMYVKDIWEFSRRPGQTIVKRRRCKRRDTVVAMILSRPTTRVSGGGRLPPLVSRFGGAAASCCCWRITDATKL